jgi:hypothetical protein
MLTCDVAPCQSVEDAMALVAELDLSPICRKLRVSDPVSWPEEKIEEAERLYRRFLALNLLHPGVDLVPSQLLDEFWHQHIIDTRKYAEDCERLFGGLLHHDPYFGINGEEDRANHAVATERTRRLWLEAFGEPLYGEGERCSSTDCR